MDEAGAAEQTVRIRGQQGEARAFCGDSFET
jgi:hypothetical protein